LCNLIRIIKLYGIFRFFELPIKIGETNWINAKLLVLESDVDVTILTNK
jgi:hypothetical protein